MATTEKDAVLTADAPAAKSDAPTAETGKPTEPSSEAPIPVEPTQAAAPAPLLSAKRERKRPVKFEAGGDTDAAPRRRERKQGTGVPLGKIPNPAFLINASKAKDAEVMLLHRFCYGVNGTPAKRKEDLRRFSGFVFEAEKDRTNMRNRMTKENVGLLRKIARLVDVPLSSSSAHKADVVSTLMIFLEKPAIGGERVNLAAKSKERKEKRARAIEAKKNGVVLGKGKGKKKGKKEKATDTDSESGTGDDEGEDEVESRAATASTKKKKKVPAESEDADSDSDGSESADGKEDDGDVAEGDSDHDEKADGENAEEPASKKAKFDDEPEPTDGGPSNAKLREAAEELVEQEKSDDLTMREIRTQLETSLTCTLSSRMAFLRKFVTELRKQRAKAAKK